VAKATVKGISAIAVGINFTRERVRMKNKMENKIEDHLGNLDDLKTKIAEMCIDWTGDMAFDYYILLARVSRKYGVSLEYQKSAKRDNTYQRFQYEFPMFFWWDMPSALFVRKIQKGVFHLVDENGNFLKWIDEHDFTEALVDDFLSVDYGDFSVRWNEFIVEFQKWLEEEMD